MEEVITKLEETNVIYKKINEPHDDTELKRYEETLFQIVNEMKEKSPSENIEIYSTILKETLEKIRELKYTLIETHKVDSSLNKVMFSKQDLTKDIIDIKSI